MPRSKLILSIFLSVILLAGSASAQQTKRDEGIDLFRADKFTEAATKLEEATTDDKTNRLAWLFLAAAYKHLGKDADAEKAFKSSMFIQKTGLPEYDKKLKITMKPGPRLTSPHANPETYSFAVECRADGTIGAIVPDSVRRGSNADTVLNAVKKIEFEPAVQNGKPVSVITVIEYTFSSY